MPITYTGHARHAGGHDTNHLNFNPEGCKVYTTFGLTPKVINVKFMRIKRMRTLQDNPGGTAVPWGYWTHRPTTYEAHMAIRTTSRGGAARPRPAAKDGDIPHGACRKYLHNLFHGRHVATNPANWLFSLFIIRLRITTNAYE